MELKEIVAEEISPILGSPINTKLTPNFGLCRQHTKSSDEQELIIPSRMLRQPSDYGSEDLILVGVEERDEARDEWFEKCSPSSSTTTAGISLNQPGGSIAFSFSESDVSISAPSPGGGGNSKTNKIPVGPVELDRQWSEFNGGSSSLDDLASSVCGTASA